MNDALKTLEAVVEMLYQELKRVTNDRNVSNKTFELVKSAKVDAINLKAKIQDARGWNIKSGI